MINLGLRGFNGRTRSAQVKRFVATGIPAGIVTFGLYAAMQSLIHVDDFSAPDQKVYELSAYIEHTVREETAPPTKKPPRPNPIDPPPMADPLVKTVTNPDLPISGYEGIAPAEYNSPDLKLLTPRRATSLVDRTIQPITPPIPIYPDSAANRGITGSCDVHLSVSPQGEPFNISAKCTDRVFKRAAETAVRKVKFAPKIYDGLPVSVTGVVYPIVFQMDP